MDFDEFSQSLTIILGTKSDEIRASYIEHFVDTTSDYYQKNIAITTSQNGEKYYFGYLWDCLKVSGLISEQQLYEKLRDMQQGLFFLWDLHSSKKILIKDYWKFPLRAVLSIKPDVLIQGMAYLPEDIYIFNSSLTWSLILTHEYFDDDRRWCLESSSY